MTTNAALPGWLLLLVGIAVGQSHRSMDALQSVLSSFQTFVDVFLVPFYALCILLYLARLALIDLRGPKKQIPPPHVVTVPVTLPTVREDGVVDMNGSFKLVSNDNFEGLLEVQGVPWALRRAANQARPIHKITHVGKTVTIQIKGIIESETTYEVDGPPVQTKIRSRVFEDRMKYLESGDGVIVTKSAITEDYDVTVIRRLTEDRQGIIMTCRAIFRDGRDSVQSVQVFKRIA
jgi:hypothetical protein